MNIEKMTRQFLQKRPKTTQVSKLQAARFQ